MFGLREENAGCRKPKRRLTAYNVFFREQRQKILADEAAGGSVGFAALARTIATRWKDISPMEHANCVRLAAEDTVRYQKEMEEWSRMKSASSAASATHTPARYSLEGNLSTGTMRDSPRESSSMAKNKPSSTDLCSGAYPSDYSAKPLQFDGLTAQDMLSQQSLPLSGNPRGYSQDQSLIATMTIPTVTQTGPTYSWTDDDDTEALQLPAMRSAPTGHLRGVFDETWLEPSESFDLDGDTGQLYRRMLNSASSSADLYSYQMKFANLR